jgi:hypothetical protein
MHTAFEVKTKLEAFFSDIFNFFPVGETEFKTVFSGCEAVYLACQRIIAPGRPERPKRNYGHQDNEKEIEWFIFHYESSFSRNGNNSANI